ncbi:MAG: glucokinase [Rhodobacteraceae bacterium]|nr:glucokinase [Paracoccaceae bacterium]
MCAARPADVYSLVADIGGTNTRVALAEGPRLLPETIRRFRNADYAGLETVLRAYVEAEDGVDCRAASVAIAGPVRDGRGTLTNLDWTIDEATLARATQAETVAVLNDLQAQGHALGRIAPENLREVVAGAAAPDDATQLVIGIGTGFNVAPVHYSGTARNVAPSESGHANLPIRTEAELRLCKFVETAHGFPAVEDVLSGRGLERLYAWLGHEAGDPREATAAEIMAARDAGEGRAVEAARVFVRMLGTVAGNQALVHLPFGGIFLAGGVARAFAPHLATYGFSDAFRDKGRFAGFMSNFPVHVIEDDYAALTGSAAHLARLTAEAQGAR